MSKDKATGRIRVYPSTQNSLKVKAAKVGGRCTIAQIVHEQDQILSIVTNKGRTPYQAMTKAQIKKFRALLKKAIS